jgi:SpoVK/Ycf46/Vps4 family AAA+-type ATPase
LPDAEDIEKQLDNLIEAVKDNPKVDVSLDDATRENLVRSAQGLTMDEIESALARSLVENKKLTVDQIIEEKKQIVRKTGMLEFYPAVDGLDKVGGHDLLKDWLKKRSKSFTQAARDFGIPSPKGILLLGVQGCGKSLVSKAVASAYNLPMLKMDVGRIFGSLVGQSEQNMRRAISIAESLAPCVLWLDELEKGFAGVGGAGVSDSGTTARVFSTFLTWMQEKTKPVFLIATANNVSALPPELLRKGRFDEIFFIDLPEEDERKEIFDIHLSKRNRKPRGFKTRQLAKLTKGFSGAEIEQVVIGALNHAFDEDREIAYKDLSAEARAQVPLSRTMAEDIQQLRSWASVRARPSSKRTGELEDLTDLPESEALELLRDE